MTHNVGHTPHLTFIQCFARNLSGRSAIGAAARNAILFALWGTPINEKDRRSYYTDPPATDNAVTDPGYILQDIRDLFVESVTVRE